jgi:hypothetical protein
MIQFSKPKMQAVINPGAKFMQHMMYSARDVLVPGGAYDRNKNSNLNMV